MVKEFKVNKKYLCKNILFDNSYKIWEVDKENIVIRNSLLIKSSAFDLKEFKLKKFLGIFNG